MGALSNLGGWFQLAKQGGGQVRQAVGQTIANIGSRVTPQITGSGSVTGLANRIAGTNVTGTYDKPYIQPKPARMVTSQVNNGQTLGVVSNGGGNGGVPSYSAPTDGGGGGGGDQGGVYESTPEQPAIDYDALIAPALEALDAAIAPQESAYSADVAGIEANRSKQRGELQQSYATGQSEAGRNRARLEGKTESAIDESRRQFSEIQQGLQARYGGTTGSGGFVEGLAGRATLQNIGAQRRALTEATAMIDDRLEQVRSVTDLALQDVEQQTVAQKAQAKAQLDNALNSIRIARGELLSRKVELAQQAMQFYQSQVADVNARNAAFKQQLYRDQQAAEQRLLEAKGTAAKRVKEFQLVNINDTPFRFNPYTGTTERVNTQAQGAGQLPGAIYGGQEEDLDALNQQAAG